MMGHIYNRFTYYLLTHSFYGQVQALKWWLPTVEGGVDSLGVKIFQLLCRSLTQLIAHTTTGIVIFFYSALSLILPILCMETLIAIFVKT